LRSRQAYQLPWHCTLPGAQRENRRINISAPWRPRAITTPTTRINRFIKHGLRGLPNIPARVGDLQDLHIRVGQIYAAIAKLKQAADAWQLVGIVGGRF